MPNFIEIGPPVPEIFQGFYHISLAAIFVIWPGLFMYKLVPPFLQMLHTKFGYDWLKDFKAEIFENGGQQQRQIGPMENVPPIL